MEPNKRKYNVEIAGIPLTIVTDEQISVVESIVTRLNERISEITGSSRSVSTLDACLLCAIDSIGEKIKAEKELRKKEAQISVYEENMKRLRTELDEVKAQLAAGNVQSDNADDTESTDEVSFDMKKIGDILRGGKSGSTSEDKIRTLEKYLESKKSEDYEEPQTREEKIRYIESLLRGNEK